MTGKSTLPLAGVIVVNFVLCGMSQAAAQNAASLNPMNVLDKTALKNFLERPLFDASRRLPPVVMAPVASKEVVSEEAPPPLRLLGVIHGVRDMAIVQRTGETKTTVLRTGDHFGNWTATVVPPVGIRLRSGKRAFDYALFSKFTVSAGPVISGPAASGPLDAIGMPEVMPNDWGISPN